jgi:hypothetical protein
MCKKERKKDGRKERMQSKHHRNWTPQTGHPPDSASKTQVPLNSEIMFKEQFLLVKLL